MMTMDIASTVIVSFTTCTCAWLDMWDPRLGSPTNTCSAAGGGKKMQSITKPGTVLLLPLPIPPSYTYSTTPSYVRTEHATVVTILTAYRNHPIPIPTCPRTFPTFQPSHPSTCSQPSHRPKHPTNYIQSSLHPAFSMSPCTQHSPALHHPQAGPSHWPIAVAASSSNHVAGFDNPSQNVRISTANAIIGSCQFFNTISFYRVFGLSFIKVIEW